MSDQDELLVISLWQPWASWVMWGWKTIETRTHPRFASLASKRIGIHAAKRWDSHAVAHAARFLSTDQLNRSCNFDHAQGALICTAYVTRYAARLLPSAAPFALIECATPRTGIWLCNIEPFNPPIPMRGHQGIWKIPFPLSEKSAPSAVQS